MTWKSLVLRSLVFTWVSLLGSKAAPSSEGEAASMTCQVRPLDLVFVLDGSRSVLPRNFQLVKGYVKNFTTILANIGPDTNQVGVVQYGSVVREEIRLNQFDNRHDLNNAIDNIVYMQTGTMTGEALKYMVRSSFSRAHGARLDNPLVHRIAVIITDGRSQDYARGTVTEWQAKAKASGIEIYSIGVGRKANEYELKEIASEPSADHTFHVRNFDAIHMVDVNVRDTTICDVDECETGNHGCNQVCVNAIGTYRCECYDDFILQADGFSCIVRDPCRSNPCSHHCLTVEPGSFQCECPVGMRLDFSALNCVDLEECVENLHECDQICINTDRSYECDCRYGYTLENDGRTCTKMNPCLVEPCSHSCSVASPGTFVCSCPGNMQLDSSEVNCVALPAPTPSNLSFSRITHTSAKASWEVGDFDERFIDHYVLVHTRADGLGENTLLQIKNRTANLVDLDPSVEYNVSVSAVTEADFSTSVRGSFRTLSLGDTVVTLSDPTLTTLTANWEEADGDGLTGYEVRYQSKEDPDSAGVGPPPVAVVRRVPVGVHRMMLTGLTPNTDYVARVIPLYGDLVGIMGTDEEKTDALETPTVEVVNSTLSTIEALWRPINYPVKTWTAIVTSDETGQTTTIEVNGDIENYIFSDLLPSKSYSVYVVGHVVEGGEMQDSPRGSASGTTKSLTPPPVDIVNVTQSTLTVDWEDINIPADHWTVRVFPKGHNRRAETMELDGDQRTATFEQLRPSTQYVTEVIGHVVEDGKRFDSPKGRDTARTLPAPPSNIRVTDRGYTYLVAAFEPTRGDADRYEAECVASNGDKASIAATVTGSSPNYEIRCEGLHPATDYSVILWTVYRAMESVTVSTRSKTLTPMPARLTITEPTSTSLLIEWQPLQTSSGAAEYYLIYNHTSGDTRQEVISANTTRFRLVGLIPNTLYEVRLIAVLNGENSQPLSTREKTLNERMSLTVGEVGFNSITASWDPSVMQNLQHYKLTINPTSKPNMVTEVTFPFNVNSYTFSGLRSSTTYRIALVAVYSEDSQSEVTNETATTRSMPPIGPLDFSEVTERSFLVSWRVPESEIMPNSYVVTFAAPDETPLTIQGVKNTFLLLAMSGDVQGTVTTSFFLSGFSSEKVRNQHTESFNPFQIGISDPDNSGYDSLEELAPETNYNVTVIAMYPENGMSDHLTGNVTTLASIPGGCSCRAYMKTQALMHDTMFQLMQQIQALSDRIDMITRTDVPNLPTEINGRNRRSHHASRKRSSSAQDD